MDLDNLDSRLRGNDVSVSAGMTVWTWTTWIPACAGMT